MKTIHRFTHGMGDSIQFTAVINHLKKHRPTWDNQVAALVGKHTAFDCGVVLGTEGGYPAHVFEHHWSECSTSWADSPGTKTCKCLRETFGIQPNWHLLRYQIPLTEDAQAKANDYIHELPCQPFALIHYQGNTATDYKNLGPGNIVPILDYMKEIALTPVILDWDFRSPLIDQKTVFCPTRDHPMWGGTGTGDAAILHALMERAYLFIGVDSGPQKVAFASRVPTIAVWTRHHPYHYADNTPNAVHLVPHAHIELLKGNKDLGMQFFQQHYLHKSYRPGWETHAILEEIQRLIS